ncbi:MAG: TATA-box-binding protein [Candidatus Nezhaarchaeales archaeon]
MLSKPRYRIENVVASVTLDQNLDLDVIAGEIPRTEYNPDAFPGLIYRLEKPKTATLIFSSGKMVCTGAKSEKEVYRAVRKIVQELKQHRIVILKEPKVQIQNIVASANLNAEINLEKAAYLLENSMYEPEQFPGLITRLEDLGVVLLLFSSGKMVCTGAKREEDVKIAVERIYEKLRELGVLYRA